MYYEFMNSIHFLLFVISIYPSGSRENIPFLWILVKEWAITNNHCAISECVDFIGDMLILF